MTPQLLSPEEQWENALADIAEFAGTDLRDMVQAKIAALEAEVDEANAVANVQTDKALRAEADKDALQKECDWARKEQHRHANERDEAVARVVCLERQAKAVTAAFEATHAKALVRARNAAREQGAQELERLGEARAAIRLRAMKETEG